MNRPAAVTVSLVPEARGGPFVLWGDLEASCRTAKGLGFDGVELFAPSPEAVSAAGPVVARHGLKLAAVGTGAGWVLHQLTITSPDADVRARARRFVVEMIAAAAPFGAPAVLGSMQGRRVGSEAPWIADALAEFDREAGRRGVRFLLEPLNRYEGNVVNTLEEGAALIRDLRHTELLADCFHMNIEETSIPAALRDAGRRVGHVQLADSNRRPAGLGHTDWPAVAAALRAIEYQGWLSVEALPYPDPDSAARLGLEAIRRFF
jgi:sugar phosphate isomerase/epimerase